MKMADSQVLVSVEVEGGIHFPTNKYMMWIQNDLDMVSVIPCQYFTVLRRKKKSV